jgi:hypothetical protein
MATTLTQHPARDYCLAPSRAADMAAGGRYQKLFPELEPLRTDETLLHALGVMGGACDGSQLAARGGDDGDTAAGWPFFGQFVAHDLTADRSPPAHTELADRLRNARDIQLSLESIYGQGPAGEPYLYDRNDGATLLLGRNDAGRGDDLPRNQQGIAIIADPRNDSHTVVSQLHVAFAKAHNGVVARLRADGVARDELFDAARRSILRHYHWVVVEDFLPTLIGRALTEEIRRDGCRYYHPQGDAPFIPLEFADAAYRYGHGQIRHAYQLNQHAAPVSMFPDLLGFRPVPSQRCIDWSLFFDVDGAHTAQRAKRLDGRLPAALLRLPVALTGDVDDDAYHSLAARDLQRGHALALPSGEAVARHVGVEPLTPDEVGLAASGWPDETPLWYYVLKEGEHRGNGDRLGPVGGRIVGEVVLGLLMRDPEFYATADPAWRPSLPANIPEHFTLADFLAFGGSR